MKLGGACAVVFAATILTIGGLPGREHAVCAAAAPASGGASEVETLEARVASHPDDLPSRTALARAYLDADSPGLAMSTLESAPASQQSLPPLQHMAARVFIEQGRAQEALALERSVLGTCGTDTSAPMAAGCDFWVIVSATRRAGILEQLVKDGVEDAIAQPEASLVAYHKATHETHLAVAE